MDHHRVRRVLISVSDKTGLLELALALSKQGAVLLSTGGTAKFLTQAGVSIQQVSDYTGFPEMLDGRVKTLHPIIHAALLARPDDSGHQLALDRHKIEPIDLLVVNLYPFQKTIAQPQCSLQDAIEQIDIGGPAMLRSGAKNWQAVGVVTDPSQYKLVIEELEREKGLSKETRFHLAVSAFNLVARYDGAISNYLSSLDSSKTNSPQLEFPAQKNLHFLKMQDLRYGENPHQLGALYKEEGRVCPMYENSVFSPITTAIQLQGKPLSYNNIADADTAWSCVTRFEAAACVIVKHANPCGVALSLSRGTNQPSVTTETLHEAYLQAFRTDPDAAFGGIIAFNRTLDLQTAQALTSQFAEVVIAPGFSEDAKHHLASKPNVRLLLIPLKNELGKESKIDTKETKQFAYEIKKISGGVLLQTIDICDTDTITQKVVTRRKPNQEEWRALQFAWRVSQFVKSNAIVFCSQQQATLGIGAGQMSRIDSARIAKAKAEQAGLDLTNSVAASDAFFPFRDGLDILADAGVCAVIHPGGSIRDQEVIAAANERNIAMVLTGVRHFRH